MITLLLPELILIATAIGLLIVEITHFGEKTRLVFLIALFGLAAAAIQMLIGYVPDSRTILGGKLVFDGVSQFFRFFSVFLGILIVLSSQFGSEIESSKRAEYYLFLVSGVCAACLISVSADLLLVFLGLQLLGVVSYFLAGYSKRNQKSTESSAKLLIFFVFASGLYLYASSALYSVAGSLNLYEIKDVLQTASVDPTVGMGVFLLFFVSLSFFFGVFPMHYWVPDVLEGSPTSTTIFLGLAVPAAGYAVAIRFFTALFVGQGAFEWQPIVAVASGLTLFAGGLLAVRQKNAKRMMSSLLVAQLGYFLMGLLVLDRVGISSLLFNFIVLLFCAVGAFSGVTYFKERLGGDDISDFKRVSRHAATESICLVLFTAGLIGVHPFRVLWASLLCSERCLTRGGTFFLLSDYSEWC